MSRPEGWGKFVLTRGTRVRAEHQRKREALRAEIDAMVWPDQQLTDGERRAIAARVKAAVMNCRWRYPTRRGVG